MNSIINYVVISIISYLIGSICVGVLISKNVWKKDVRDYGSKSAGATNVLRNMGLLYGLLTFAGDLLKVVLACIIGKKISGLSGGMLAGLIAVLGHNWPIYHKFKGGKGVAGSLGAMIVLFPLPALYSSLIAITIIIISKYVSLGSITLLTSFAIILSFKYFNQWDIVIWAWIMAVLSICRHKTNIKRLLNNTENKISLLSKPKQ